MIPFYRYFEAEKIASSTTNHPHISKVAIEGTKWVQYITRSGKRISYHLRGRKSRILCCRDLYISFKRRLQRPWILDFGKQTIYPTLVRPFSRVLFFQIHCRASSRVTDEMVGSVVFRARWTICVLSGTGSAFHRLPETCRKRNIMAASTRQEGQLIEFWNWINALASIFFLLRHQPRPLPTFKTVPIVSVVGHFSFSTVGKLESLKNCPYNCYCTW